MSAAALLLLALLLPQTTSRGDGFDYLKQGKPGFARTAFRNQLKRAPADVKALGGLGMAELALGNDVAACTALLDAIEKGGGDAATRLALARAFLRRARGHMAVGRGDEEETRYFLLDAETQAQRAAALAEKDPEPWAVATEACLELGEIGRAESSLAEAEKRGLDAAGVRRLRGHVAYYTVRDRVAEGSVEDYQSAKAVIDLLLKDDPKSAELWLRLGDLEHAFGRWLDALAAWKRAFEIEPFDRPALDWVLAYLKVEELAPAARATLEAALATAEKRVAANDPRPGYALFCVGQSRLFEQRFDDAAALFKKARALDDSIEVQCALGLAEVAFKERRYPDAAAEWKRAFAADREVARALLGHLGRDAIVAGALQVLATQSIDAKKPDAARELLEYAWLLQPDEPTVCNDYAFLCRETGKHAESWTAYSHLIEIAPTDPRYLNDAGLILHDYLKRDLALARSLYDRAIESADALIADPKTPQAAKEMAQSAKTDATNNRARLPKQQA